MIYARIFNKQKTAQNRPIPGAGQSRNNAGGFGWKVDVWMALDRFLILGSESGTYYVGERELTTQHYASLSRAIKEDGLRVVARIVEVSESGRAPKNDPAIFALAVAASEGSDDVRAAALASLPKVCRTGTHLFAFAAACRGLRGWGRGLRRAVGDWYNAKSPDDLVYSLIKYQERNGWSNRDLFRLSHVKPLSTAHGELYRWVTRGEEPKDFERLKAVLALAKTESVEEAARLIRENRIPREATPTEFLKEPEIWEALLEAMPLTAVIRNLGVMSAAGVLAPLSSNVGVVCRKLGSAEALKKAKVHPIQVLIGLATYSSGRGVRGSGSWEPVGKVIDALNTAFYTTFAAVEPTKKRLVLGLDVSGSMAGTRSAGSPALECRQACAALALITASVEERVVHLAFDEKVHPLPITPNQRLDDVVRRLASTGGGGTDCSAPIRHATQKKIPVDAFIIYTDSESWQGRVHPSQAMEEYRKKMGIEAKLVVVAMASNRETIGDPRDSRTLNVVGFDATVPGVISDFVRN